MSFAESIKSFAGAVGKGMLPAIKSAFSSLDPQYEYGFNAKSFPDREKSRYCIQASVHCTMSVNLPGDSDLLLADAGGVFDVGKSSNGSSGSTDSPSN